MKKFALIGAAGFIAPRHLNAIKVTNNELVAAYDPFDSVGIIDSFFPEAFFFTEFERFDRHLDKLRRGKNKIDYLSICSPNYLHDAHIRYGLRNDLDVICEKPLVLNPWNIDGLKEIENDSGRKVYTILQLRLHESAVELKKQFQDFNGVIDVELDYITSRGNWYNTSWKGDIAKSGGVVTNIGIHFFDMLIWVFGDVQSFDVDFHNDVSAKGTLKLEKANVSWFLSIDSKMLPKEVAIKGKRTYRSLRIDRTEIEFSEGFTELHNQSYSQILSGKGFGLNETEKAIMLVSQIRKFYKANF